MSSERIAGAAAIPVPGQTGQTVRQPHPFYEGEFIEVVRAVSAKAPTPPVGSTPQVSESATAEIAARTEGKKPDGELVPHPFYEDEMWNPNESANFFGKDGFGIADVLDVINPLQHIPVISSIYRSLTGDEISPGARLAGGAMYGGPLGLVSAVASGLMEEVTDTSLGDIVVAAFSGDTDETKAEEVAALAPAAGTASPAVPATAAQTLSGNAFPAPPTPLAPPVAEPQFADSPAPPPALPSPRAGNPVPLPQALDPLAAAFPQNKPSPLAFARGLLESPGQSIAAPSAEATRSVIAADELNRQQADLPDAVAAVLAARSQVPRAGVIPGITSQRHMPQPAAVESRNLPPLPAAAKPDSRATAATESSPTKRDGEPAIVPGKRGAPPLRNYALSSVSSRRRSAAGTPVPGSMVPKAMMSALDKYQAMVESRRTTAGDDLTM